MKYTVTQGTQSPSTEQWRTSSNQYTQVCTDVAFLQSVYSEQSMISHLSVLSFLTNIITPTITNKTQEPIQNTHTLGTTE